MFRKTIGLASAAVLTVTLGSTVVPAQAGSTAACSLDLGSVTAAGAQTTRTITASTPIGVSAVKTVPGVYPAGSVQHISTFKDVPTADSGHARSGLVVMGGALYNTTYNLKADGQVDPAKPIVNRRVGGGWSAYRWIEQSVHQPVSGPPRTTLYGQETVGFLQRWNLERNGGWRDTGGIGGLSTVKSMTLIHRDNDFEVFLANTRAGGLLTVLVQANTYPMVTYGTPVRDSTWQVFEQLIATDCGYDGSLVLGIDRDTSSAYLYSVSNANGRATVIKNLGKVPGTFNDPQYFRFAPDHDTLNGY
jgi:hypothetical protein